MGPVLGGWDSWVLQRPQLGTSGASQGAGSVCGACEASRGGGHGPDGRLGLGDPTQHGLIVRSASSTFYNGHKKKLNFVVCLNSLDTTES